MFGYGRVIIYLKKVGHGRKVFHTHRLFEN